MCVVRVCACLCECLLVCVYLVSLITLDFMYWFT